jgi:hypothetical protein
MTHKCPHCGKKVGREAVKCWNCRRSFDDHDFIKDGPAYTESTNNSLFWAGLYMIIGGVCYFVISILIFISRGYYSLNLFEILAIFAFIGGFFSIIHVSYKFTTACVLISGLSIGVRSGLYFGFYPLYIIPALSLVFILLSAQLIYKNKHNFG